MYHYFVFDFAGMLVESVNSYSQSKNERVFHHWVNFICQGLEKDKFSVHFVPREVYEQMLHRVVEDSPNLTVQLTGKMVLLLKRGVSVFLSIFASPPGLMGYP